MAALNARRRPGLKTYGSSSKKPSTFARSSQQGTNGSRAALARSASEAPAPAQQDEYDPYSFPGDDSSPEPLSINTNPKVELAANKGMRTNIERKRKIAHVYPTNDHGQDPLSEHSSPVAPRPKQRSRVSSPTENVIAPKVKTHTATRRLRSTSIEVMDLDAVDAALSSPPPTPLAPKERKSQTEKPLQEELPFSPNTMHILGNLNVADTPPRQHHQIPVRPRLKQSATAPSVSRVATQGHKQHAPTTTLAPQPAKKPRRKLIDALVEQMEDSDDPTEEKTSSQVSWTEPVVTSSPVSDGVDSESHSQTPKSRRTFGSTTSRTFARSGSLLKRTYGQKVTLLEEDNLLDAFVLPEESGFSARRRLELTPKKLSKTVSDHEEHLEESTLRNHIKDIHELKQAGANSRVADEMMDLSTRINQPTVKPSSNRRGALLEIAEKSQRKDFRQRLCDYGIDAIILKGVGDETDMISGYLIAAILLQMLAGSTAPHIIQILQNEDAGNLFGRLLQQDQDIMRLARDRKSNLSKRYQGLILTTQTALLKLPIWEPAKPESTSPRTLAAKCLELIISQDAHLGTDDALFPPSVTKGLFDTIAAAQEAGFWDNTAAQHTFDVHCALSVLEYHAVKVMEAQSGERLAAEYLPSVADAFGIALQQPTCHDDVPGLLLKLVLNMTNSSVTAPDIFIAKGLLLPLSMSICASFTQSLSVVAGGKEWTDGLLDGLVLRLGILINFAEQSTAVREAVYNDRNPGGESPTKELIRLFLANHRSTADVSNFVTIVCKFYFR